VKNILMVSELCTQENLTQLKNALPANGKDQMLLTSIINNLDLSYPVGDVVMNLPVLV
jgi:hypothetical protein